MSGKCFELAKRKRIIFLDYLRVFAFGSVLIGHKMYAELSTYVYALQTPHITQQYIENLFLSAFYGGGAGVIVFFMISGYIILHILQTEKPIEFVIKRVFRIYPLFIFAIIVQAVLYYMVDGEKTNWTYMLQQMTLLGDFFNTPYALNGIEWTLRVEIMFYALMYVLSILSFQKYMGYRLLFLFFILIRVLTIMAPFPTDNFVAYFSLYFPFLFLGAVVYMYEQKKIHLGGMFLFVLFVFHNYFSLLESFQKNWLDTNFAIVGFLIFMFLWSIRAKLEHMNTYINNVVIKLSLLTYSIYLFHNFLWDYFVYWFAKINIDSKILVLLCLMFWCYLMYQIIEKPMNRLGKKIAHKYIK